MAKLRLLIYITLIILGILIMRAEVVQYVVIENTIHGVEIVTLFWYGLPISILGVMLVLFDVENLIKELKGNATN